MYLLALGEPTCLGREEIGCILESEPLCLCKSATPLSPQGKNKHTPKLLLNTLIDGDTVYETEPHTRAITGQMIEHEVFFVTADYM